MMRERDRSSLRADTETRARAGRYSSEARAPRDLEGLAERVGNRDLLRLMSGRAQLGQGTPLDARTRERFETSYGASLADVRIHTDERAAAAANALDAEAFTVGRDVAFGRGRFTPGTPAGDELLAHELAHAVQHPPGASASPSRISSPGERAEVEADRAAQAALAGRPAHLQAGSEPGVIHCRKLHPQLKTRIAKLAGGSDLDELLNNLDDDGQYHVVHKETIDGVEHVWEIKLVLNPLSDEEKLATVGKRTGGVFDPEPVQPATATDPRVVHRGTLTLRGDKVKLTLDSTDREIFHELIHARIFIDRDLPEASRSQIWRGYALAMEMGSAGIMAVTSRAATRKTLLIRIEKVRAFYKSADPSAIAAIDAAAAASDDAILEFLIQEKFANQTADKSNNASVARRYAPKVESRFAALVNMTVAGPKIKGTIAEMRETLLDELRLAIERFFDAIDANQVALSKARQAMKELGPPPDKLTDPGIFETRPLDIGGKPIPFE